MRNVCVFTGSRSESGLLIPLMQEIHSDRDLCLQILVSGTHLSPEFGLTVSDILNAGLTVQEEVEVLLSSDSPVGVCKSMGLGLISYSEALERLKPDLLLVLGDRFEAFSVAAAASVCRIPVAHIHGGETTQGAVDECFRHSITKMSHLHFTTTDVYRRRVIQLGEQPSSVFNVGALGIDNIRKLRLLTRNELEDAIQFSLGQQCILVTFHPVTLEQNTARQQFQNLLDALACLPAVRVIFTKANADMEGRAINAMIDAHVAGHPDKCVAFASMGQLNYLSALQYVNAVVGNSSSGIIEAPSFNVPTVNIGDRQKGRVQPSSVINCSADKEEVLSALTKALTQEFRESIQGMVNPYEKEDTVRSIVEILKSSDVENLLKKGFNDVDFQS